ncbi:MAG: hypothetical protein G01um101420_124 [Parcubacteria group bacterium Gr01-1014_20]|nr:MAG: hypothetical protein G01um101420_124 [Parcubacteria group bacterium Gr01-1014_20]
MGFESFPSGDIEEQSEQVPVRGEVLESKKENTDLDFESFLEKEVFTNLGVTLEDEKKYLETVEHQDNQELMDKVDRTSFSNIRDSIRMFLDFYCKNGIYDHEKMRTERKEAEEKVWSDFWQEEGGRTSIEGEKIDSKNRPLSDWENGREVKSRVDALFPREYLGENRIVFDKEEVVTKLSKELAKIKEKSVLTYNVDFDSLEKIFETGKILPMTEQSEEVRSKMRKEGPVIPGIFGFKVDSYEDKRKASEELLGIYPKTGNKPVYAALAGGSDWSLERGAAPQYGELVLVLEDSKLRDRVIFTEGDSMNPMGMIDAIRGKENQSDRHGLEHRLLNRDHAQIAKAIYNLSRELEKPHYGKGREDELPGAKAVQYIEAQVLGGIDMSYIKEIIVNYPEDEFGMEGFKEAYPKYSHLIRFAKNDSGS